MKIGYRIIITSDILRHYLKNVFTHQKCKYTRCMKTFLKYTENGRQSRKKLIKPT